MVAATVAGKENAVRSGYEFETQKCAVCQGLKGYTATWRHDINHKLDHGRPLLDRVREFPHAGPFPITDPMLLHASHASACAVAA